MAEVGPGKELLPCGCAYESMSGKKRKKDENDRKTDAWVQYEVGLGVHVVLHPKIASISFSEACLSAA